MTLFKQSLFIFIFVVALLPSASFGGEKGGSGISDEEEIILENFSQTQICPEIPLNQLCSKIDQNVNDYMWATKPLSRDQQNQINFYTACCAPATHQSP